MANSGQNQILKYIGWALHKFRDPHRIMASSELLKQIQAAPKLKRTININDRSAPQIMADTPGRRSNGASSSNAPSSSNRGPPRLAGFAGGMPKLKPAGQSKLAAPPAIREFPSTPNRSPINELPAPVQARVRLPSRGSDMGCTVPISWQRTPPAIPSESPLTPRHPPNVISRSTLAVPSFRIPSPPLAKPKRAPPDRAPPPPPKPSYEVASSGILHLPLASQRPPAPQRKVPLILFTTT